MNNFILLLWLLLAAAPVFSQTGYTAHDTVPTYFGQFCYGANMGAYLGWRDENLADIAAGNTGAGVKGVGIDALRLLLSEWFLEYWGYDIRLDAFQHYGKLGVHDNVVFVGYPSEGHRDLTYYCGQVPSELFANLYLPIWDGGENGTPVNDSNFYAVYLYEMVSRYHPFVKFWEIWNEPDFDFVGKSSLQPGEAGNWWEHDPDPCEYALRAPVQHYIRMLRISYEVIKYVAPDDFVAIGGIGYPSFLDVVLRNTDNPNGGVVDSLYPLTGGAYFDVVSYHSYPHIDNSLRTWDNGIMGFRYFRHSDRCVDGLLDRQAQMRAVLEKYGYDGEQYPQKLWIVTESNIPRAPFGEYLGSAEAQRNYLVKAFVASQMNEIHQLHVYQLGDIKTSDGTESEFFSMGLYHALDSVPPYQQRPTHAGVATRTVSMLLGGKQFDAEQTAKLQLPANIRGGAFRVEDGTHTYVLWARTSLDRSEKASAVYNFPASLNIKNLNRREWDFGEIGITTLVDASHVTLTGSPVFLTDSSAEQPAEPAGGRIELTCGPNPFSQNLDIRLVLPEPMVSSLAIYDMHGRLTQAFFTKTQLAAGGHSLTLDGSEMPPGVYVARFQAVNGRQTMCKLVRVE